MIITRDRLACLKRSATAVLEDSATSELVIVDDGSIDGTWSWLLAQLEADDRVSGVQLPGVGPNAARQKGIEHAQGDIVVLLDDDVVPGPRLVSGYVEALVARPHRLVAGYLPVAVPERRRSGDVAVIAYARDYERRCARYESGEPVLDNLWGGNVGLWRAAALDVSVGAPPGAGDLPFHEDRDFGLRAAYAGFEGVFRRDLVASHRYARSPRRALDDAIRRGQGIAALHARHSEVLGPFDPRQLTAGLPRPLGWSLRAAVRLRADRLLRTLLLVAVGATGMVRRWSAQDALFKLARRAGELRGARDVAGPA